MKKAILPVVLSLFLLVFNAVGAAPTSENFDEVPLLNQSFGVPYPGSGPGYNFGSSPRTIGDWTFSMIDNAGANDGGAFVDVTNSTNATHLGNNGSDKALNMGGTYHVATAGVIKSTNGAAFSLTSFDIENGAAASPNYKVVGYLAGTQVVAQNFTAKQYTQSDPYTVTLTDAKWENIDEFRIVRQDGSADVSFYIDDIEVATAAGGSSDAFITTWQTTTANETITIPVNPNVPSYAYNYTVDWGDGNTSSNQTASATHTYASAGTHTVSITGDFPAIQFGGSNSDNANDAKLLTIEQWGTQVWLRMDEAFMGCVNLTTESDHDAPVFAANSALYYMFSGCSSFNSNLNDWNVSNVEYMSSMFASATSFNQNLSKWDVSNVKNMNFMFSGATSFDGNLSGWQPTSVTNMYAMFAGATAFNQDLSNWDVSNVKNMRSMFRDATSFNGDLSGWQPTNVTTMYSMFFGATAFNGDISGWNVSNVTNMSYMFASATAFNQDLNGWDVSKVTDMSSMFYGATSFNQDLISWDVSKVQNMSSMFEAAVAFNGNISNWQTGNVTDMSGMFHGAHSFNQDLISWDVSKVTDMSAMFASATAFNGNINSWQTGNATDMSGMFYNATSFNSNISSWQTGNVTDMSGMFHGAHSFNQDLISWDVSKVTDMSLMFPDATAFNGNISNWNTGSVTDMSSMFFGATAFNQDLSSWNVSNVTDMSFMFYVANAFNQDLGSWTVSNVTDMTEMLSNSGLSITNYDSTLIGWAAQQNIPSNISLSASGLTYCAADSARQALIDNHGWTINGDSQDPTCNTDAFITTWKTTTNESITIPINPDVSGYNYTVDWGDGNTSSNQTGNATHTYANAGTHTVSITGNFPAVQFGSNASDNTNDAKLLTIEQWGTQVWQGMDRAFMGCVNLTSESDHDAPVFATNATLYRMFYHCSSFNSDLNDWDVSKVTDMSSMFLAAKSFNQNLNNWDVSKVTNMSYMFASATAFNGNISSWDVSKVKNMSSMFVNNYAFNQDIGDWNVGNVENMESMFRNAAAFDQDISSWKTDNVTNMFRMFLGATSFNQDISGWSFSKVTIMQEMFKKATAFNQNLGNWDISNVTYMKNMLSNSGLSTANYDSTLIGWAAQNVQANVTLGAGGLTYCAGETARQSLIDDHSWTITGDSKDLNCTVSNPDAFITTWKTTTANESITIPINNNYTYNYTYNYTVDWGDGSTSSNRTGNATHTYANAGTHTVSITGDFPAIQFGSNASDNINDAKLLTIEQWGTQVWQGMDKAFMGCVNLTTESDHDAPIFATNTTLYRMFGNCSSFNSDLSDWDLSPVNETSFMFYGASLFNSDISGWDVSNVTNMELMFAQAEAFNQNLNNWNVSNVTLMRRMFYGAIHFNQNLKNWDVSEVGSMAAMFYNAAAFNQDLGSWVVSNVTDMIRMLDSSGFSTANYDSTLIGWAAQNVQANLILGTNGLTYCASESERQSLIDNHGWLIIGDSKDPNCNSNAPVITSNGGGNTASVSIVENTKAVTTVTATDADAGTILTYSLIGGADQTLFSIDSTSGVLAFKAKPDFESPADADGDNNYEVTVQASDGTNSDNQTITVSIKDVSEKFSIFIAIPSQDTISLNVYSSDTIQQVKQQIQDSTGINPSQQQLHFSGQILDDGRTLADYNIRQNDILDLTVIIITKITQQPKDTTVCPAASPFFVVTATGTNLSYQWQSSTDEGANWGNISGETATTLSLSNVQPSDSGTQYRVIVSGTVNKDTSSVATLRVHQPAQVVSAPQDTTVDWKGNAQFKVVTTGEVTGYQWQYSTDGSTWNNITGETAATLDFSNLKLSDSGVLYRVIVRGPCAAFTTQPAKLHVNPPLLTLSPGTLNPAYTQVGYSVTFEAQGGTEPYQYSLSNSNLPTSFTFVNGQLSGTPTVSGTYTFTVTATDASTGTRAPFSVSHNYQLKVLSAGACMTVSSWPSDQTVCEGAHAQFAVTGTGIADYQWQSKDVKSGSWTDVSGATGANLSLNNTTTSQSGMQYRVVLTSNGCGTLTSQPVTLTVNKNTTIINQPTNQTVGENDKANFSVTATGTNITYQWQSSTDGSNWSDISGETTATLNLSNVQLANSGTQYRVMVIGACGTITSNAATLTVEANVAITKQPDDQTVCENGDAIFSVTATGTSLTYQWQSSMDGNTWNDITNGTSETLELLNLGLNQNGMQYRVVVSSLYGTITSDIVTLTVNAIAAITTQPTNQVVCENGNTSFTVAATGTNLKYQWQSTTDGTSWNNVSNATSATLNLSNIKQNKTGTQYRVIVSSACGNVTSASATLSVRRNAAITTQPVNQTVCENGDATFKVTATGTNLTYQWQSSSDGTTWNNVANATTATLNFSNLGQNKTGTQYHVIVNSACGNVTSASATLSVRRNAAITTQPVNQTVCENGDATFSVSATGTNLTYQWQNSSDGTIWNNVANATAATLNLSNLGQNKTGTQYRVIVNSACGNVTSDAATLTVNAKTTITTQPTNQTVYENEDASFSLHATGTILSYQWQSSLDGINWTNMDGEKTKTLQLNNLTVNYSGTKYRVIVHSNCEDVMSKIVTLTVKEEVEITGISLENTTFIYDGQPHTLTLDGNLPAGASVTYENNEHIQPGAYTVKALINGGSHYQDDTLTATLTIEKAEIDNISLQDKTFTYDGQSHTLVVSGDLPNGVSVDYENNEQTDAGTYTVKAFINGGKNYQDDTLTGTLAIEKAAQEITFASLSTLLLEEASDFQLTAQSNSGLPVTYTFTAEDTPPAAEVSSEGKVTLIHSGKIIITAHQEGNENYLPADSVSRTLTIESQNADIDEIIIDGKTFKQPDSTIYYREDCGFIKDQISVAIHTEFGATVTPAREFMIATPKPGIYKKEVTVTSQNKQRKPTYRIIIERPFAFEDIVIQKFNNTLLVNNNPKNNGGYRFVKYQWYKNGQPVSREQVYSVGDESTDLLDEEATYSVVVTTEEGDKIHTCPTKISFDRRIGIEVYPNPVARQSGLQLKVKYPGSHFPGAIARLYSLKGRQILTFRMKEKLEKMKLPVKVTTGVYILVIEVNHHKKTTKIFVTQ